MQLHTTIVRLLTSERRIVRFPKVAMTTLFICVALTLEAFGPAVVGRRQPEALKHPLSVSGIKLGDSYSRAIRVLGRPRHEKTLRNEEVEVEGDNWYRKLDYEGLMVECTGLRRSGPFVVRAMTVTGPTWRMGQGLKLGMTYVEVQRALGVLGKTSIDPTTGTSNMYYLNSDGYGWAKFEYVDERLTRVSWSYDFS